MLKRFWCCAWMWALLGLGLGAVACGNPPPEGGAQKAAVPGQAALSVEQVVAAGSPVKPPFALTDGAEGLLLVWYDADGAPHSASTRSDVPEDRRAQVRVDSLAVAPDARLDPALVYVADLRTAAADGSFPVRTVARDAFENALVKPTPDPPSSAQAQAQGDVIIYGASWCGACRQAASYLRQKQVPFVEKDIEKEPGARSEMQTKARAQGVNTSGIPVIDVYGTLLGGFDRQRIDALLARK